MTISASATRTVTELLATVLLTRLQGAARGHCARVDYLTHADAAAICRELRTIAAPTVPDLAAHVLAASVPKQDADQLYITTDRAVELRNRKNAVFCLFVPADLVDAAFSSLANSFELIDGRQLQQEALELLLRELPDDAVRTARMVFTRVQRSPRAGDEQRLDFASAIQRHILDGTMDSLGRELWLVGLIPDAGADFADRLDRNRRSVQALSHPPKLQATVMERVQSLGVDVETRQALVVFFRDRSVNDARAWTRALATTPDLTFDRWRFPHEDPSDLTSVVVAPFVNEGGVVERYCHLHQPDGPSGALRAYCGPKETLVVRWRTEPANVKNLARWHVEVVPADSDVEDTADVDMPARIVPAKRKEATLKLDLELDEPLDYALHVRVTPLDAAGNQIVSRETGEPIYAESDDFYLMPAPGDSTPQPRETRAAVPTLAYGRLHVLVEKGEAELTESYPQWQAKDLDYFAVRLNERHTVTVALSPLLHRLEERVIEDPASCGRLRLLVAEVRPADVELVEAYPPMARAGDAWQAFLRAREAFFTRLRRAQPRGVIETAEWTAELAGAALRHAQTYRQLLESLLAQHADDELRDALSVDTLLVRIGPARATEEALVLLPTHPLRAAWFASYTQLLREWERRLGELPPRERRTRVDLGMLRQLAPANTPAFAFHPECAQAFIFAHNLHVAAAVALPPEVPDPHRRYADLATIVGASIEQADAADLLPDRLAERLETFRALHPYADPLVATLLNPDRGDLFADALTTLSSRAEAQPDDDADEHRSALTVDVTAYVEDMGHAGLHALERLRRLQAERKSSARGDQFLPSLAVTLRDAGALRGDTLDDAHVVVVTDYTRPSVCVVPPVELPATTAGSFSLYGLITRFVSTLAATDSALLWRYHVVTGAGGRADVHPTGPRYGETLHELHGTFLDAVGRVLSPAGSGRPALEIRLDDSRRRLLDALHRHASWVITLDRFLALDYYDSPHIPRLSDVARTYVLDYSPEFTEGLGHRLTVTTAWHDEIYSALVRAMEDLGFAAVDQSVRQLLHFLKTVSGQLALRVLSSPTMASAAVGLGVVTAWLQAQRRLAQAVLIPVDLHPHLFSLGGSAVPSRGERRCDLVLLGLRRNIVDATFIEVKWRRGTTPLEGLARDMLLQMSGTAQALERRCFDDSRPDGALQRAYLANVLRFYFERSKRYSLFDSAAEATFLEHLTRLEKAGLDFRPTLEGFIVSLDSDPRSPWLESDGDRSAKITLLTARDFEDATPFHSAAGRSEDASPGADVSVPVDESNAPSSAADAHSKSPAVASAPNGGTGTSASTSDSLGEGDPGDGAATHTDDDRNVSDDDASPVIVPLGEASGVEVDWRPSTTGSPHLFIAGIPGQGKSWAVSRLLTSLGEHQVPSLVLDFHGQFSDPSSPFVRRIHPVNLDAASGLPFSPFELPPDAPPSAWRANAYELAEIFGYVADLGDIQQDAIYQAIRDAYQARGYGSEQIPAVGVPTLEEVLDRLDALEQTRRVANVTARCRPLLEMELFRPTPGYPDLLTQVRHGLVIDLHTLSIEAIQLAAGAFVLRKLYKDMFRWGVSERLRLAIVLDEAHRLARDVTLPKLMKEGRKFGVAVIVASQGLADFHPDIVANAGTKVIFRTNYPDSRRVAGFIRARQGFDLAARIEQLPVGSAYVQTPEMAFGAQVRMYPLI
jgi:DNA phosphorothioation-dependent restriction protein DptH